MTDPAEPSVSACQRPLDVSDVSICDDFWAPRIEDVRTRTLPRQYELLRETGRLDALSLTWKPGDEPVPHIFWDSDVVKWVEAASYSLATSPDPVLEEQVDDAVARLAGAQQPDGYLNTYFTVAEPGRRWTDLRDAHELYCAGHLVEAGVAHFHATGKRSLLDVARRYADHIGDVFGVRPGQRRGYDGHEEIELALVRLYRATGERRYLELSRYFVDERGREPYYFDREATERGTPGFFGEHFAWRDQDPQAFREYNQTHLPVREQRQVVGHAVRAMYLYCAMADLAGELPDDSLLHACRRLWQHLVSTRMYVTGGIGSTARIEGFTRDYDLPNETAYAETCAAVGLVFWAHRMALVDRDRCYTDVLERALYNGALSGLGMDGTRFFYANPLASRGDVHRQEWFGVACCPPNIARLLTSLGRFVYSQGGDEVAVHLYLSNDASVDVNRTRVSLRQRTGYPWDGHVRVQLGVGRPTSFALALRIPSWCRSPTLTVAARMVDVSDVLDRGYARVEREWRDGDEVELDLPMPVERVYAHPRVIADAGRVALQRGPLVYCLESADHTAPLESLALPACAPLSTAASAELPGVVVVQGDAECSVDPGGAAPLYAYAPPGRMRTPLTAVPYYAWDNREPGEMLVWIRESGREGGPIGPPRP